MSLPSATTAAAVSSQLVSIPSMFISLSNTIRRFHVKKACRVATVACGLIARLHIISIPPAGSTLKK